MKTITLQPWQVEALQAGRLKSVWVPLEADKTCEHAARRGIDLLCLLQKWLPYAVGDVVRFWIEHDQGYVGERRDGQQCFVQRRITAVSVRRVESITEQEMLDTGATNHTLGGSLWPVWDARYRADHPTSGQWAVKIDLEEMP